MLLHTAILFLNSALAVPASTQRRDCGSPSVRVEWGNLSEKQKQAYLSAEKCLFTRESTTGLAGATNLMEDLAAVHQTMSPVIHGVGQFLPWHRFMLHAHELLLRSECGYAGPMAWWDETKDAGAFEKAELFSPAYFGSAPLARTGQEATCITDGAFARTNLTVGPGTLNTEHCLSRAVNDALSELLAESEISYCNGMTNYTDMWMCVDGGYALLASHFVAYIARPHAAGHDAMGGVMADVDSSPGDPVFYMHHTFLDRNWAAWQSLAAENLYAIGGNAVQNCRSGCGQTTLNYTLSIANIIPQTSILEVMDVRGGYLCYSYDY